MLPEPTCGNCRYARPLNGAPPEAEILECHGSTPAPILHRGDADPGSTSLAVWWPRVRLADWCGSHTYSQAILDAEDGTLEAQARKKWGQSDAR